MLISLSKKMLQIVEKKCTSVDFFCTFASLNASLNKILFIMSKFQKFYEKLNRKNQLDFQHRVLEQCKMKNPSSFRQWSNGLNVPEVHQSTINTIALEMFGKKIF